MKQTLVKYFRIYRSFIANAMTEGMSFRVHFILLILMDLIFYISTLASVDFIFNYVDHIGPWDHTQFMFFIAFMLAMDQFHMTFISESFWDFSFNIRTGALDFILLKPIGSLFPIFFGKIRAGSAANFLFPWGVLIWFGLKCDLSLWAWVAIPFLIILSLSLLVSIEILISMAMFWTVESFGINFIRMGFQTMSRWPDFIYGYYMQKAFTIVLPILTIGSLPVKVLLGQQSPAMLYEIFIGLGVSWFLIGIFWRKGLKGYESASS
ncbi:MAG: hypothetical protein CMP10_09730 [Zetaproteobacteria bacterium]|nr:hypothetical protein [Pseudobdellovibrionaceae bacterium]